MRLLSPPGNADVLLDVAPCHTAGAVDLVAAVAACRAAEQRIIVVSEADGSTALSIARELGIVGACPILLQGWEIEQMPRWDIEILLERSPEIVVAATNPEATQRIVDVLRHLGRTVEPLVSGERPRAPSPERPRTRMGRTP